MSYIYVAESGNGICKIGKSENPEVRKKQIESVMGIKITRFKFYKCDHDALYSERLCHDSLKNKLAFSEYFHVEFDDACKIAEAFCKEKRKPQEKFRIGGAETLSENTAVSVPVEAKEEMEKLHKRLKEGGRNYKKADLWNEAIKRLSRSMK